MGASIISRNREISTAVWYKYCAGTKLAGIAPRSPIATPCHILFCAFWACLPRKRGCKMPLTCPCQSPEEVVTIRFPPEKCADPRAGVPPARNDGRQSRFANALLFALGPAAVEQEERPDTVRGFSAFGRVLCAAAGSARLICRKIHSDDRQKNLFRVFGVEYSRRASNLI